MPPEFCEYGPDFESHCDQWLAKNHPEMRQELAAKRGAAASIKKAEAAGASDAKARPADPWTTEERLLEFYKKYMAEKVDSVPALLEKYEGKEDKLFTALVKKYGPEPDDPFYDSEDESDDEDDAPGKRKNKRRGVSAKKDQVEGTIRVVVQKVAQKKKRHMTIIHGMDSVPDIKLKDVSKAFSKRFAGSSSVKDNPSGGKEIILQGDHMYDVAEMIVDKFNVPESCVFLNMDDDIVPLR